VPRFTAERTTEPHNPLLPDVRREGRCRFSDDTVTGNDGFPGEYRANPVRPARLLVADECEIRREFATRFDPFLAGP